MNTDTVPTTRVRNQWWLATRFLSPLMLGHLLMATGVMVALMLIGHLLGRWFNWSLVIDVGSLQVDSSGDEMWSLASPLWLMLPLGVTIGTVVVGVAFAATRTRPMILAGLTRGSVAVGMLLALVANLLYTALLYAVVFLIIGQAPIRDAFGLTTIGTGELVAGGALSFLSTMLAGVAIVALFQRWPWWVGTIVLLLLVTVVPMLFINVDFDAVVQLGVFWEVLRAVLLAVVYWLLMRRVPVP